VAAPHGVATCLIGDGLLIGEQLFSQHRAGHCSARRRIVQRSSGLGGARSLVGLLQCALRATNAASGVRKVAVRSSLRSAERIGGSPSLE